MNEKSFMRLKSQNGKQAEAKESNCTAKAPKYEGIIKAFVLWTSSPNLYNPW